MSKKAFAPRSLEIQISIDLRAIEEEILEAQDPEPVWPKNPGLQLWEMGGRCTALRMDLSHGFYLLITDSDNMDLAPNDQSSKIWVGVYNEDDDYMGGQSYPTEYLNHVA